MDLTARVNGPPRLTGSGLIVICSYRGGNGNAEPKAFRFPFFWRILNVISLLQLRRFIAAMRDHFANPRALDYQLAIADAVVARSEFSHVTVLADSCLVPADTALTTPSGQTVTKIRLNESYLENQSKVDTVVLVYPDALGLTWASLERSAARIASTVVLANGRRRLVTWDRKVARSLALRRFLANSRLVELICGIIVVPAAGVLAAFDFARGRA